MSTERDELVALLADHRSAYQCDGDYGEMQWVECSCGSDYYVDTDAGYAEHEAHLADLLAARDRRVQAEALREAAAAWPIEVNVESIRREIAVLDLRETPAAYLTNQWLRDRAARIEADA